MAGKFIVGFADLPRRVFASNGKDRQRLIFYIAIPLVLGFFAGWHQAGRTTQWPKINALGFWLVMSLAGWWINDLVTRALAKPLRAAGLPLWTILLIGVAAAAIPSDMVFTLWVNITHWMFPELPSHRPVPPLNPHPIQASSDYLNTHLYGFVVWPLINLALFHFWKMPRYGFQVSTSPAPQAMPVPVPVSAVEQTRDAGPAPFTAKLPDSLQGQVLALEAEQHYLRVYTDTGSGLILYRLCDAMRELGPRGMQVHRSFWVASGTVKNVAGNGASLKLVLRNGIEIPVSRSFRHAVQVADYLKERS